MQRREGLIDPSQEQLAVEGRRPIQEHLADFGTTLEAKGDTPDRVKLVCSRLKSVIESCGFERLSDLTASTVQAVVASLRDSKSLRTCNGYLRAVKGFGRWAWHDGRLAADPLASLQAYNEQTDRRRVRRAISIEEFIRLIDAAEAGPTVEGIPGPARSVMYVLSAWTGYRRRELASLTFRSFVLDTYPPTVTVQAAHSKRRRTDTQVLHPVVVERLTTWLAGKPEVADHVAAIESLPFLPSRPEGPESGQQSLEATGTDDAQATRRYGYESGQQFGQQLGGKSGQIVASSGEKTTKPTDQIDKPQVVTLSRNEKSRQAVATTGESGDERARTANPRLAKPVLSRLSYVPEKNASPQKNQNKGRGETPPPHPQE